ncbi:MAG: CotH kinase family protein, partial [Myxococcales bacterium]|nr:CotH kinase family protein [Myxococcales bacterium]
VGVERTLVVAGAEGDRLDFAIDPTGPNGDPTDGTDHALLRVEVRTAADYQGFIEGELVPIDHRPLDVRVAVAVPPDAPGRLALEVRYDDGFVAWLDGEPVGQDNAPDGLLGQAPVDRSVAEARRPVRFPLPSLAPGSHVLALRHFDAAADDGRGLLLPEVVAEAVIVEPGVRYLPRPTPGEPNLAGEAGPIVLDVTAFPGAEPAPGRPVTVYAEVVEGGAPLAEVRLVYRIMFGPEVAVPMALQAGRWAAEIPGDAGGPGELVRWRVEAVDEAARSARLPRFDDPLDSEAWQGTVRGGHGVASPLPVFHLFIEDLARANSAGGTRGALYFAGTLYDNVLFDLHGQSTRGFPKKSYDVDFTKDHRFRLRDGMPAWKDLNLLTNWADKARLRNTVAYEIFAAAGNAHHWAEPVRLQLNGEFFAVYDLVEDGDDRWLERLGYAEPLGALYKMYDRVERTQGGEKKTRQDEDKADLQGLIDALGLEPAARRLWLLDNIDLARTANYLAASVVMAGRDCCHKNYYLYRDTEHTAQWWFLPWDVDLSLGRNWTGNYFDDTMYPDNGLFLGRDLGARNNLLVALYALPEFTEMYLRRVRTLMDALVQPVGTPPEALWLEGRVAHWQAQVAADMALDDARWNTWGEPQPYPVGVERLLQGFAGPRRVFLYGLVNRAAAAERLVDDTPGGALARWRVPGPDTPDDGWIDPDYVDDAWAQGPLALGYENAPADYAGLLRTQVRPQDEVPGATTIQARVPFTVADPAQLQGPVILRLRYEDGVVVWLNGVEVHRELGGDLAWNGQTPDRSDGLAVRWLDLPVDPALLRAGDNVLAAQVVNTGVGSSDLLLQVAVLDGEPGGDGPLPLAQDPEMAPVIDGVEVAADAAQSYVRLHNPHGVALDLSDWRLLGAGVEHVLTPGTVLPAGGDLYLVGSVPGFQGRAEGPAGGQGLFVQGHWMGALDPVGAEPLQLLRSDDTLAAAWGE